MSFQPLTTASRFEGQFYHQFVKSIVICILGLTCIEETWLGKEEF